MAFGSGFIGSLDNVLKTLIGASLVLVTVGLVLYLTKAAYSALPSWEMQIAVAGCVILMMSFLSYKLFSTGL
ncbi:MAG: hypothetical protein EPO62_05250 [Candidatus Nitrosotenuis sp.]|nr:MAG: hypothetical protein EPO62_05250 [Candidatus Nitrosotenuis sp.]